MSDDDPIAATEKVALPRWVQPFNSLRFRNYRLHWLGQVGSSMGQWMDQVARGWLIYELTDSAFLLGLVNAARAVPFLFFGPIAGVAADRFDRKRQLVLAHGTDALIFTVLAVLVVTGRIEAWHVFATALLVGIVQAFYQPARFALISDLVGEEHLANAIALNSTAFNSSRSLGPSIAGIVIAFFGVGGSFLLQALFFIWAAIWTYQIVTPKVAFTRSRASVWGSMLEGFAYVRSNRAVLSLLVLALIPNLLGMPYSSLMPIFARDILEVGPVGLGLLMTGAGIGALGGALSMAALGNFRRKGLVLLGGATLFGVMLTGLALSHWFPLSLLLMVGVGFSNTSYMALANTLIQTNTPPELRGRVLSIYALDRGLVPLGTLLVGTLADLFGAPFALSTMGAACTFLALGVAIKAPYLRGLS